MADTFLIVILILCGIVIIKAISEIMKRNKMTPEERIAYQNKLDQDLANLKNTQSYGTINPEIICPHCQTKGSVRIKNVKRKKGISGAKATGALLTGGISILATGLSRKEGETQAHCVKCSSTWYF